MSKTHYHMKGFIPKVALNQRQNELRMMAFYIALDDLVHHRKLPLPQYVVNLLNYPVCRSVCWL